jgi:hypothetical protein
MTQGVAPTVVSDMAFAANVLRSASEQTQRLLADLGAPAMAWMRGLVAIGRAWRLHRPAPATLAAGAALGLLVLGVIAVLAYLRSTDTRTSLDAQDPPTALRPLGPVKIIDATPRGAHCEEQVWPYIEQRCLRRAPSDTVRADAPASAPPSAPAAAPSAVAEARDPAPRPQAPVETTGAASSDSQPALAPDQVPVDANGVAPRPRGALAGAEAAMVGAATAGLAAWPLAEPSRRAEPRRRPVRRFGRSRGDPFRLFGLRF